MRTVPEGTQHKETVIRVLRHLGVREAELARRLDVDPGFMHRKLHLRGPLSDKELGQIAKALKIPKKILVMSAVDAIQFLLDREKAAS